MRRIVTLTALASALAASACATSSPQPPTAQAPAGSAIATQHPYEMKGRVQSVGAGLLGLGGHSVTIARDDAPAAVLHVADATRISFEGRASKLSDLRPGDDVRAVFDFDKDAPVAIQIDASRHH